MVLIIHKQIIVVFRSVFFVIIIKNRTISEYRISLPSDISFMIYYKKNTIFQFFCSYVSSDLATKNGLQINRPDISYGFRNLNGGYPVGVRLWCL